MKPLVLCILDGVGIRSEIHGNAVKRAEMPTFNMLLEKYPNCLLDACGESVGLPKGQMGNSEVGHTNIGAGRIVYQPLLTINKSIEDKSIFDNKFIIDSINHTKKNNSKMHIFGLLSDGGVHSHINHLFALIDMCKKNGINKLYIHIFLDGRDTLPTVALNYIEQLEHKLEETNVGKIATISGRYYAMDRDSNFDRVKKSYDVITSKQEVVKDYKTYIKDSYKNNINDEFIVPIQVDSDGIVEDNDSMIVFNFRPDRLRELFGAITHPDFNKFEAIKFNNIKLLTMFPVNNEIVASSAFKHQNLTNTFGSYIASNNLTQLRIAETEKYAHVTYFFDGGKEMELNGAKRVLVPSSKVATYDLLPEMSALEITNTLTSLIDKDEFDVIILNYANGDMVGHTGDMQATIKALETLDICLGRLFDKVKEKKGIMLVTADHGNSDYMLDDNDNKITSHSMSKVPLIITESNYQLHDGKLSDIAPTMLEILNLKKPQEMTGTSLIVKKNSKTKRNHKKNIFMILSLIVIVSLLCIYAYRFIHYYNLEYPKISVTDNTLTSKILSDNMDENNISDLTLSNDKYFFVGETEDNYVLYSGILWRIVNINSDKIIKMVTDDNQVSLVWGYNDYSSSYVRSWINNNFYNSLTNKDFVLNSSWCIDEVDSDNVDLCKKTINDNVGLLTYSEYKTTAANKGYLNINKYWWTINKDKNSKVWYVFDAGGVSNNSNTDDTYYSYGVRPVINIKSTVEYIAGTGTLSDPYIIEKDSNEIKIGSYIKYSNYNWKVVNIEEDKIKLVMSECLSVSDKCIEKTFSSISSIYKTTEYASLANYLNNSFYYTLDSKHIVTGQWYTGEYSSTSKYDYNNIYKTKISAKVGLLNISERFVSDLTNAFTMTPSNGEMINIIKDNGTVYANSIDDKLQVRPAIYIDKLFNIVEGNGNLENPFIIE